MQPETHTTQHDTSRYAHQGARGRRRAGAGAQGQPTTPSRRKVEVEQGRPQGDGSAEGRQCWDSRGQAQCQKGGRGAVESELGQSA
jgi:hypothetical protein